MAGDESSTWMRAFKTDKGDGRMTSCQLDDPEADFFSVSYPGMPYSSSTIDFRQDDFPHPGGAKFRAENVMYALSRAFEAGRKSFQAETRRFLGIKQ